ncbi:MAG: hypothetical protein CMM47_07945 [Rhodospirillaceae bacterium]|nr:hypothetical protein [Rhodospirillaceae bacterium]
MTGKRQNGMGGLWSGFAISIGILAAMLGFGGGAWAQTTPQYGKDMHIGVTSCAGSTCHGATSPWENSTVLQNEYITWSQKDPHGTKAYKVLLNDESKRIAKNLGLANAHEADLCLDCHADNAPKNKRGRFFQISDGVGCEACHGGAERWLGIHVSGVASHQDNIKAGLYATEDPVARAELCLSCHFGDDKKFVTHQIMGAGHPRMSFELDTFTAIQPAHYVVDKDYLKRKKVANGIRTWAIGQAIALKRRVDAAASPDRGWDGLFPELVLFDCQACHHPLTAPTWQPRPSTGLSPGVVRFDDSNLLMLAVIASHVDGELGVTLKQQTKALHGSVLKGADAYKAAANALKQTADTLVAKFASRNFGKDDIAALMNGVLAEAAAAEFSDYAGAEQATMALSAISSAARSMGMGDLAKAIDGPLNKAYDSLEKYDGWDYAGFRAAISEIKPIN